MLVDVLVYAKNRLFPSIYEGTNLKRISWCFWGLRLIWLFFFNFHPNKNTNDPVQLFFLRSISDLVLYLFIYFSAAKILFAKNVVDWCRAFFACDTLQFCRHFGLDFFEFILFFIFVIEPSCQIYLFHICGVLERT